MTPQQELIRFLEVRFACAQTCVECARVSALRAALVDPDGSAAEQRVRRAGAACVEVCDATCDVLSEEGTYDEAALRIQVEWCRAVCLEGARVFDAFPGAEAGAEACRVCARACTDFLAVLRP